MNKTQITDNFFEAIDIIMEERIKKLQYSQCYLMKILSMDSTGMYSVSYQGANYKAKSLGHPYRINDMVWVLAPRGSLEDELTIVGIVDYYYQPNQRDLMLKGKVINIEAPTEQNPGYWICTFEDGHFGVFWDNALRELSKMNELFQNKEFFYFEVNGIRYIDRPVWNSND